MSSFEKLKNYNHLLDVLTKEREEIKNKYYDKKLSYENYMKMLEENEKNQKTIRITIEILKNNLFTEIHQQLLTIYKELYKKYENKNIGDKRKEEITNKLREEMQKIIYYDESEPYFKRIHLYFNCGIYENKNLFNIEIKDLDYYFSYYVENEEIKSKYNFEILPIIKDEEIEAKRLIEIIKEVEEKREEIKNQLTTLREKIELNFSKNLYSDDISNLIRKVTMY